MLKLEYLYENYELARLALANWRHDEDGLDGLLARFRISNNAVYPFRRDGGLCFLRLTPVGERLERNVFGEMEFLEYLGGCGYPAVRCIPADTGEKVLKLGTPWGGYYAAAFEDVGGECLEDTGLTPEAVRAYGRALGRLHALSEGYRPKVKKWSHADVLDWTDRALAKYHAPEEIIAAARELRLELAGLPQGPGSYGLIHYDFELDNVFYDRGSGVCRAIDFDDSMYHWYAMDVERALMELEGYRDEFIRGYREEFEFNAEMGPLMRRFEALYGYARLIRSVAGKQECEPEWMAELRVKLGAAIERKAAEILK